MGDWNKLDFGSILNWKSTYISGKGKEFYCLRKAEVFFCNILVFKQQTIMHITSNHLKLKDTNTTT